MMNPFNINLIKFKKESDSFLKFVDKTLNELKEDTSFIELCRRDNTLYYYKRDNSVYVGAKSFKMISNEDLQNIYDLIKEKYSSNIREINSHSCGGELTLYTLINDKLYIEFKSDNIVDYDWIESKIQNRNNSQLTR